MAAVLPKALSMVLIIVIGFTIKRIGWVTTADFQKFSRIVLSITLPCALITSFNEFSVEPTLLLLAVIGAVTNIVGQVAGFLVNRKKPATERAFAMLNIPSYNIGAFSVPYLTGFMGPQVLIFSSLFDVGNAIVAAGSGYAWAKSVASGPDGRGALAKVKTFAKTMFSSAAFVTYLFLLTMQLFHLRLPSQVITFTSTVGAANPFLAMLMIGIGLELKLDARRYGAAARYLGIRYGLAIIFTVLLWTLPLPLPRQVLVVTTMILFAPIAAMETGFTAEIGGDVELSSFMNTVTILIAIVAQPLILMLLS